MELWEKTVESIIGGREGSDVLSALSSFTSSAKGKAKEGAQAFLSAYEKCSSELDSGIELETLLAEVLDYFGLKDYYEEEKDASIREGKRENLNALANSLAEYGVDALNVQTVMKQAALAILINTLITLIHGAFFTGTSTEERQLYQVKTRKILLYSNCCSLSKGRW